VTTSQESLYRKFITSQPNAIKSAWHSCQAHQVWSLVKLFESGRIRAYFMKLNTHKLHSNDLTLCSMSPLIFISCQCIGLLKSWGTQPNMQAIVLQLYTLPRETYSIGLRIIRRFLNTQLLFVNCFISFIITPLRQPQEIHAYI